MREQEAVAEAFVGGGEMGALMRSIDWASTPVGPVERWPQSLRTALSIVLASRHPLLICWGKQYVQLYNDAYRHLLGGKHFRAMGRPGHETWPEIWETLGMLLRGVLERGESTFLVDQLFLLDRGKGYLEECYFDIAHSPIRDESGGVGGVFVTSTETTERVLGVRRLRILRALAACTSEQWTAEAACQEAGRTLALNPHDLPFALLYLTDFRSRTLRLAGAVGVEAGGPAAPLSVDLAHPSEAGWPFASVVRGGVVARVDAPSERVGVLPGGPWPEAPSSALLLPITQPGHAEPSGLLVVGVSPHLELDEAYRDFLGLVAAQVASATATARALEEERRRAERLAELDRAKTAFFSNVSHEFRTPLTLMLGPLEDALASPARALQADSLQVVHRNGLRLLKLVNALLEFSRIEAGRAQAHREPTDLSALTGELASGFRSLLERAGLALTVDCPPLPAPVWVDRQMWEKVVLNLLSNAFKFTFAGEIAVRLRGLDERVELSVEDTGTGIPPEEVPRVFERFHRVQGARGRSHEGSGIGLALVQELAKLHGGGVRVESRVGRGSTFTVSLPMGSAHPPARHREESRPPGSTGLGVDPWLEELAQWTGPSTQHRSAPEAALPPQPAPPRTAERAQLSSGHILLADDNADMRAYLRRLLEGRWSVEAVADGAAALEAARRRLPDLVLSDVMMPGLDGFGLLRELRADARTSTVPVILLSARAGEEATVEGFETGADDYLVKPFSARELLARVEGHLAAARARQEKRQAEQEREKLVSVVEQSSDFIGLADADGRALYVNEAGQRLVGLDGMDAVHRTSVLDSFPEEDKPYVRDTILPALATHGRWEGELRFRNSKTGTTVPVHYNLFALKDRDTGERIGMATVTRDITERKRQEADATQRAEFERQLIGIVSHDLRNPISAILLAANALLKREGLDERAMRNAARVATSAERASRLIRDLLDFTRARLGGGLPIEPRPADFHQAVRQALEEVQVVFPEREVHLVQEGEALGAWDVERLGQVVQNLVTNALRYSPPATPVRVATRSQDTSVLLEVHNAGQPISRELLPRLFHAMERGAEDMDRAARSIGLGLFIVDQVVRTHGGTITVVSTAEEGTTFTVRLPRYVPARRECVPEVAEVERT